MTPAEVERLVILIEECSEVIKAATKALRHGYDSPNPDDPRCDNNRNELGVEIGHLHYCVSMVLDSGDVDREVIITSAQRKRQTIKQYLHHQ